MAFYTLKDGAKMFYKEEGSGSPPLVLLHGVGDNSWSWNRQVPLFSKFYRVITPDLKGHGASDKPQGRYSVREFTEEVNQLLDKILGKEKFVLCGHSLGGMISLTYAIDPVFSKTLKGAILCNTPYALKGNPGMKGMADALKKGFEAEIITKEGFNLKFQREHKDIVQMAMDESLKCPKHVMISCLESFVDEYDLTDRLSRVSVPVLVITGDADATPANPKNCSHMKEHIKNSRLVVFKPAISHFAHLEAIEEFNKAVKNFMDKLE
jgi:3-oxoadipate enol-lactonase